MQLTLGFAEVNFGKNIGWSNGKTVSFSPKNTLQDQAGAYLTDNHSSYRLGPCHLFDGEPLTNARSVWFPAISLRYWQHDFAWFCWLLHMASLLSSVMRGHHRNTLLLPSRPYCIRLAIYGIAARNTLSRDFSLMECTPIRRQRIRYSFGFLSREDGMGTCFDWWTRPFNPEFYCSKHWCSLRSTMYSSFCARGTLYLGVYILIIGL